MEQTFIIKTYGGGKYDFNRVACTNVETCIKYLKNWKKQAIKKGFYNLFANLLADDAIYKIVATPDGYHEGGIVATGLMSDL